MNDADKEYLLSVLDEVVTELAANDKTNPNIYNRISRAMTIVEKSIMESDETGYYVDARQQALDFHPWQQSVYDDDDTKETDD